MFKVNDRVKIKDNLIEELSKLNFDSYILKNFSIYIGTKQTIHDIWKDEGTNQEFATIDLCVEIPIQCLELINEGFI